MVDRKAFTLRFFSHLKPARTYPIAVGRQGLETPAGLYDVQWKQTNPSWYVPNSAWAGKLAGKVIPPGPDDPIKARWMAFNGGAGIHGIDPSEYASIGHNASHGCVRMRIPDVIDLYDRSPVARRSSWPEALGGRRAPRRARRPRARAARPGRPRSRR